MKKIVILFLLIGALSVSAANGEKSLVVEFKNAAGEKMGTATLMDVKEGVKIMLQASGLKAGKHGIHFHEKGLCEGPAFKSAGSHFNPGKKEHGLKNPHGAHAGDLSNIDVSATGEVKTTLISQGVTLKAGATSLLRPEGASLVIHALSDDQKTNPSGESGDRIACGVVPQS